ncbi:NUDIX domain-containing protein [Methanobrevibacter curvatus]|uniref:Bifunctional NMN adenylyltransferase/nudix hydrolase n=1 Tax=Methanobrevibacter curvatus TaxID=49547 RepID=A0A166BAE0_9EURY|nr:NUDIX hydrolase [Methanobrevibacter curvatus]KZX13079.1 bifunctional NMN adenylyltransferase/nudix hydrolase [Methanobrevibacter curvatus]
MNVYKKPSITVDIFIYEESNPSQFILIQRKNQPFKGSWALTGGFIDYGESAEIAAVREAKEETNIDVKLEKLFNVYSKGNRDPRGHTITIVFLATGNFKMLNAGSDAESIKVFSFKDIDSMNLAFDHKIILNDIYNYFY